MDNCNQSKDSMPSQNVNGLPAKANWPAKDVDNASKKRIIIIMLSQKGRKGRFCKIILSIIKGR